MGSDDEADDGDEGVELSVQNASPCNLNGCYWESTSKQGTSIYENSQGSRILLTSEKSGQSMWQITSSEGIVFYQIEAKSKTARSEPPNGLWVAMNAGAQEAFVKFINKGRS